MHEEDRKLAVAAGYTCPKCGGGLDEIDAVLRCAYGPSKHRVCSKCRDERKAEQERTLAKFRAIGGRITAP
ncbi:hypothetical protein LCGC14_1610240 [marine sediment metagenome]|uniref:Uncharacterized protein n=1 Tax=marine sediment metagenome TaxID=412755 RepID=A0A0F9L8T0_9ZZZZ